MSVTTSAPLMDNEYVKEFLDIMKQNGKDASGFITMLGYVGSMESQLNRASEDLQAVMVELNAMREERNHPLRTAIQNAAQSMDRNISEARTQLGEIKNKIIEGCKNAITAFKEKGVAALNGIAKFFRIKPLFQSLHNRLQNDIKHDQAAITKIESISTKYHTAGMHLRNVGRTLWGKEPITAPKPNGKLAKLATAPFRTEIKCLQNALKDAEKAIASLDRLDERVTSQKTVSADRRDDKPSVKETMKQLTEKIAQDKKEAPAMEKSKRREAEL